MGHLVSIYHECIPAWMHVYMESEAVKRLQGIDMNCGLNYTSFPLFRDISSYTRYEHSLGVSLIVYHFTHDKKQALSGLFHDIATPAFSHVIDFMKKDYMKQEYTENDTKMILMNDPVIKAQLEKDGISMEEVCDYHIYPIADNDSPRLSSDRLEYTLSNALHYGFASIDEICMIYQDLTIVYNEEEIEELAFMHEACAERFTQLALKCGRIYSCANDRYAMERLAQLLNRCMKDGVITEEDCRKDEAHVINILKHSQFASEWDAFTRLSEVKSFDHPVEGALSLKVKKRYIDPLCADGKRVSAKCDRIDSEISGFLNEEMNEYLKGDTY